MRIFRSQAGFTITELVAVIAVSGVLMTAATVGFSAFFSKFNDLSKTMELQRDAFNGLQKIKNGIKIGSGTAMKFQGIATADSVKLEGYNLNMASKIILYPPKSDISHINDNIVIYKMGSYIRYTYQDGPFQPSAPLYLFPDYKRKNDIEVTKLSFSPVNTGNSVKVVNVEMEARVKLRNKVYKYVSYKTRMALTMK